MALAENTEESAVFAFEDSLDPGVAVGGEARGVEPVAGGQAVMHALAHRLVLGGHQAGRLSACQAECVLQLSGGQATQLAGGHRRRMGAEDRSGMPTAVEHFGAMQRVADAWSDLEPDDRGEKQIGAANFRQRRRGGQQRGDQQRAAV